MKTAKRIPVLMYHRVGEPDSTTDKYCIRPARFADHMRALQRSGWNTCTIEDFYRWQRGETTLPENSFVLTFDDGFTGVLDFAAPVLANLGWSATVFLVASKLGGLSDWQVTTADPMRPHSLMDKQQILALAPLGFSLHSHSFAHRDLSALDAPSLEQDLTDSRSMIAETTGCAPMFLAYPYGRHNDLVRKGAAAAGFTMAFSVESGFNRPGENLLKIRRLDIFGSDTPAMLLRKIRFGTNDGSLAHLLRYYFNRLLRQN